MISHEDGIHHSQSWPWWRRILTGLNLLALVLSATLSWHYLTGGSMVGCSGGSPCDQVLNSRWSLIAGVLPVSGLALGAYLAIFIASFFIGPAAEKSIRHLAWSAILILSGSIAGSAIWFFIVQKWVIGEFCFYCMTTHITGMILTGLVIWSATKEFDNFLNDDAMKNPQEISKKFLSTTRSIHRVLSKSLIGFLLACIMAAFQVGYAQKEVNSSGKSQAILTAIDYHDVPLVGSPDASYIVTLLFDYKCPHCQQIHLLLDEAVRRYPGRLAFALCPTPLNTQCNPYIPHDADEFKNSCELAKIGLAVWLAKQEAFSEFDNWMFTYESGNEWRPRSLESAKSKAAELVGQVKFNAAWTNPWIDSYIKTCIRIYGQTMQGGNGGVPKLIFGSHWVIPDPQNADDLITILQKNLGVPKF